MSPTALCSHRYAELELPGSGDPLLAATHLVADGEFGQHVLYEHAGRWSVALGAVAELVLRRDHAVLDTGTERIQRSWTHAPLDTVAELLTELPVSGWRVYGWAGFELAHAHAGLLDLVGDGPLLYLIVPRAEVRFADGRVLLRATDEELVRRIAQRLATVPESVTPQPVPLDVTKTGGEHYRAAVAAAVSRIQDRELQKVILSRVVSIDGPVDLGATYLVGRRNNTPARSFLLDVGGIRAAGFSPEIVAAVDAGGRVTTEPLAGTRARAGDAVEDGRLRADLLSDAKEIFEHAISVKVAFDELAELCESGSVLVEDFMSVKERGSVQHLASSVSGQLPAGVTPWQAFAALFPAVTASGVPKTAAYQVISDHEEQRRDLYSGAVLWADEDGSLDAALVLRTVFQRDGQTWLRAGAGIVEQSRPEREWQETCEKLRSVALHLVPGR